MAWDNGQTNSEYMRTLKYWQEKWKKGADLIGREASKIERQKKEEKLPKKKSLFSRLLLKKPFDCT